MGKPKKVEVDDDDAVFAQRAIELKGARPAASRAIALRNLSSRRIAPRGARARRALPSRSRPTPVSSPRLTFCASLAPSPSSISPDEAAKLFAARDFKKAAAAYEQGIALMAPNDPDAAAPPQPRRVLPAHASVRRRRRRVHPRPEDLSASTPRRSSTAAARTTPPVRRRRRRLTPPPQSRATPPARRPRRSPRTSSPRSRCRASAVSASPPRRRGRRDPRRRSRRRKL